MMLVYFFINAKIVGSKKTHSYFYNNKIIFYVNNVITKNYGKNTIFLNIICFK